MKKIIFLLVAIMPLMGFAQKAKLEFETTSHNFGTINENAGKATFDFQFKNAGNVPLILTNVKAGCGCTTPEWDRKPVAQGESGKIKVSFDPRNRPGSFIKSITVNSNAENSVLSLTIRGNVSRKPIDPLEAYKYAIGSVKIISNNINFGTLKNTQESEMNTEIINTGEQPVAISVVPSSPCITASVTPATLQKGQKGNISVKYNAQKKNDWGFVTDKIDIKVNNKAAGSIAVAANICEDFSQYSKKPEDAPIAVLSEPEANLTDLPQNSTQTHEFFIQNDGKTDLIIRKIKTSDNNISVNIAKKAIKPGKKVKATVTLKTEAAPKVIKIVQFTVNDPKNPNISYKITGNLKM